MWTHEIFTCTNMCPHLISSYWRRLQIVHSLASKSSPKIQLAVILKYFHYKKPGLLRAVFNFRHRTGNIQNESENNIEILIQETINNYAVM